MLAVSTKINAVNLILSAVGEAPVDTINENDNVDVANALLLLDSTSRSLQAKGWDFNSYTNYVLKPDIVTQQIRYNSNFIHFKAAENTIVKRGDYFYDMTNNTDKFTQDVILNVIMAVDFEDLPSCFKDYVTAQTALKFQQRFMGDDGMSQDLLMSAAQAREEIVEYDMNMGSYNMLNFTGVSAALSRS